MARTFTRGRQVRRSPRRKFIWDRTFGTTAAGATGVDLLAPFRTQPGASHLGATIMRVRGYVLPLEAGTSTAAAGVAGIRVDTWNESTTEPANQPVLQPDADWMAWLPWNILTNSTHPVVTWNFQASPWAVDVKSNRKLEELNETLWLFLDQNGGATRQYAYHLSIGMKLA